jgi:hypothetical protein
MSGARIPSTDTSQVDANVIMPGPTGVLGDMKTNPVANPNISPDDVGSVQHASRETTDVVRPKTKAFENKQEKLKELDPESQRLLLKAVMTHSNPNPIETNPQINPTESSQYGE